MSRSTLKEYWTIAPGMSSLWRSPQTNGKLSLLCLSRPTCSWGAACSWKEVNWWLIYTKNIHEDRRYGCSGALQRRNSCVKPASGLTIYGNMCLPEEKQIVSWSLPRSLLINSEDVSKIWGQIWQSDPRITAVVGHRGLLSLWLLRWFTLRTQP